MTGPKEEFLGNHSIKRFFAECFENEIIKGYPVARTPLSPWKVFLICITVQFYYFGIFTNKTVCEKVCATFWYHSLIVYYSKLWGALKIHQRWHMTSKQSSYYYFYLLFFYGLYSLNYLRFYTEGMRKNWSLKMYLK